MRRTLIVTMAVVVCMIALGCALNRMPTAKELRREALYLYNAGSKFEEGKEYVLAIDKYHQSLYLSPRPIVYYHLAHCYGELDAYEDAISFYEKAIEMSPNYQLAFYEMQRAKAKLIERDEEKIAPYDSVTITLPLQDSKVAVVAAKPEKEDNEAVVVTTPSQSQKKIIVGRKPTPLMPGAESGETEMESKEKPSPTPLVSPEVSSTKTTLSGEAPSQLPAPTKQPMPPPLPIPSISSTPTPTPPPTQEELSALPIVTLVPVAVQTPTPPPGPEEIKRTIFPAIYDKENGKQNKDAGMFMHDDKNILETWEFHRDKAEEFAAKKLYYNAAEEYVDALRLNPKDFECRLALADLFMKLEKFDRAEVQYSEAVRYAPTNPRTNFKLGNFYLRTEQVGKAGYYYNEAIKADPDYKFAHNNLGVLYMQQERWNDAIASFRKVVSLDPNYTSAYLNLGIILSDVKDDHARAIEYFQRYIDLGGKRKQDAQKWIKELTEKLDAENLR